MTSSVKNATIFLCTEYCTINCREVFIVRKVMAILLAALVVFTMAGCTPKDKYEIAVVTDVGQLMDGGSGYL